MGYLLHLLERLALALAGDQPPGDGWWCFLAAMMGKGSDCPADSGVHPGPWRAWKLWAEPCRGCCRVCDVRMLQFTLWGM